MVLHAGGHGLLRRLVLLTALALAAGCGGGGDHDPPAVASAPPARAHAAAHCDRTIGPNRSLRRFVGRLRRGQVGCLRGGRYRHRGVVKMRRPDVTLRPLGRAHVTIDGAIWVLRGAKGAVIKGLRLTSHDPVYFIPIKIQADDVSLIGNDITGSRNTSCVLIGADRTVSHAVVELNRIHRCGRSGKLFHLLYVAHSRGAVIRDNLLVDNRGGWAVHLYPDADGTLVEGNVMDSNEGGVIFAGDGGGDTSDGNVVRENVITNSSPRWNVESSWSGGPEGEGNVAERNCLFSAGPGAPSGIGFVSGFAQSGNLVAGGPVYVDRPDGDYRLRMGSNCRTILMGFAARSR